MLNTDLKVLQNHYATLEVSPTASERVITAAYRCLVQIHHPDKNSGCPLACEIASRINMAYSVLSDADRRLAYDHEIRSRKAAHERRIAPAECENAFSPLKSGPNAFRPFGFRPLN
jgi:molecular chaperone DnaJ